MNNSQETPRVVQTIAEVRAEIAAARAAGKRVGLVPTMGALHEGHLSLARAAARECGYVVATIFVNPTQFGPNEDYRRYPRTLESDRKLLATCDVPLVFAPSVDELYPAGSATTVSVRGVAESWEGRHRPGHFDGVATIVAKLFTIAWPDAAYFGEKDYQQLQVIRRMTADLNLPIAIRPCPLVRESDGLAMSSRNAYLSPADRQRALALSRGLARAQELVAAGQRQAAAITAEVEKVLREAPVDQIDYVAVVDPETLAPVAEVRGPTQLLVAAVVGTTRLIDNVRLE